MTEAYTRAELWERFRDQHLHLASLVRRGVKEDPLHSPPLEVRLHLTADGQVQVVAEPGPLHEYTCLHIVEALPLVIEAFLEVVFEQDMAREAA